MNEKLVQIIVGETKRLFGFLENAGYVRIEDLECGAPLSLYVGYRGASVFLRFHFDLRDKTVDCDIVMNSEGVGANDGKQVPLTSYLIKHHGYRGGSGCHSTGHADEDRMLAQLQQYAEIVSRYEDLFIDKSYVWKL